MSNNNYAGIDYSAPGSAVNRDPETGIRYGVISQHSIHPDYMSDIFIEARDITYEASSEEAKHAIMMALDLPEDEDRRERLKSVMTEFVSDDDIDLRIEDILALNDDPRFIKREEAWAEVEDDFNDSYSMWSDGGNSWLWEKDGYVLASCLNTDVIVTKSPYFTYAQFCSPCVPGAGNLDHPFEGKAAPKGDYLGFAELFKAEAEAAGFPKVLCLGHDFFVGDKAPYVVFEVGGRQS